MYNEDTMMNDTNVTIMEATVNAINHLLTNNNFVRVNEYTIVNSRFMHGHVTIRYIAEIELVRVTVLHHAESDEKKECTHDVKYKTMDELLNNIVEFLSTVDDEYINNQ